MNIQPVSFVNYTAVKSTNKNHNAENKTPQQKSKIVKAMPYIAGIAIVATTAYAFRNNISKILKKAPEDVKVLKNNVMDEAKNSEKTDTIKEELKSKVKKIDEINSAEKSNKNITQIIKETDKKNEPELTPNVKESESNTVKNTKEDKCKIICTGINNSGNPIYQEIELPDSAAVGDSIFRDTLNSVDLKNETIISKIEDIRNAEQYNINRIIGENTHDGHIDIRMMKKVANDYMNDVNRGENRYHQAADLLEQAHIREFVKGDDKLKSGMFNVTDSVVTDPVLYRAYQNMPIEESTIRLNQLREKDLKSEAYKESINADVFFDKTFERLIEKYQFKKYNEAHGIS